MLDSSVEREMSWREVLCTLNGRRKHEHPRRRMKKLTIRDCDSIFGVQVYFIKHLEYQLLYYLGRKKLVA